MTSKMIPLLERNEQFASHALTSAGLRDPRAQPPSPSADTPRQAHAANPSY